MQSKYWPYDEMAFIWREESSTLVIACPWFSAQLKFESDQVGFLIEKALATVTKTEFDQDGLFAVTEMMKLLEEFPIYFCLPRNQLPADEGHEKKSFPDVELKESHWDFDTLLQLSQVGKTGFYDPLTLLTGIRRYHLMESFEKKRLETSFEKAEGLKDLESTKKLLEHFNKTQAHPLAFAMIIDVFEQKDQLAQVLKNEAYQGKDSISAEDAAIKLLRPMPAVSKDFALSACRLTEKALQLLADVQTELCQKTLH